MWRWPLRDFSESVDDRLLIGTDVKVASGNPDADCITGHHVNETRHEDQEEH